MTSYATPSYRPGSGSSRYVPDRYDGSKSQPGMDGDRLAHVTPPRSSYGASPAIQSNRPYTPPNPEQYSSSPSYRAPLENRPANPDVQAIQAAAGYGGGRPRSSSSRNRAPSHLSARSHTSHRSQDGRRVSHDSHRSHRSRHSTAAKSHRSSGHRKSTEEPYRTESEREEYIKELKRMNSKRPTLGGSMYSMWNNIKRSLAK